MVATLIMKLQEEGKLSLDDPVKKHIPEFTLADPTYVGKITIRQLLTHTNGIDAADYFNDYGQGDDAIEKFVASLKECGQIYRARRDVVVLQRRDDPRRPDDRESDRAPVRPGVPSAAARPDSSSSRRRCESADMLVRSCAAGHITKPGEDEPIGHAAAAAPDVHGSGRCVHGRDGAGHGEVREAPHRRRTRLPVEGVDPRDAAGAGEDARRRRRPSRWAIGWILSEFGGERVLAHGGGTIGQLSFFHVLPDRPFVFVLLTNSSPDGGALFADIGKYVFEEFAGVSMPEPAKVPEVPPKLDLSEVRRALPPA